MKFCKKNLVYISIVILSILFSIIVKEFGKNNIKQMKNQLLQENRIRKELYIDFIISELDELRKYNDEPTVKKIINSQIDNIPIDNDRNIWIIEVLSNDNENESTKIIVPYNIEIPDNTITSTNINNDITNNIYEMAIQSYNRGERTVKNNSYSVNVDGKSEIIHSYVEVYEDYNWIIGCSIQESILFKDINNLSKIQSRIIIGISTFLVLISIIICKIISERKKKEEEANQLIFDKVSADNKNEAKTEFLSTISHELRTPLNAIIGLNELLYQSIGTESQIKEYSNKISESSHILLSLINDILDMAAIEKGKMKIAHENFNFYLLIHSVSDIYCNLAVKKGLNYKVIMNDTSSEFLIGDSYRIRQIILNLLSNALKFTDEGTIELKVSEEKISDKKVILNITVSDTGCGMKEDMINRLFDQFEQADASVVRKYGGSGLGLSITKNLVKNMNGSIDVESINGKGSSFSVKLPMEIGNNDYKNFDTSKIKQKVLIIGTSDKNNKIFKDIFLEWKVEFDELKNPINSFSSLENKILNFETFIITDSFTGGIDSLELANRIKAIKKDSIIILLTDYTTFKFTNDLSIDYFIQKPIIKKDFYFKLTKNFYDQSYENLIKMEKNIKGKKVLIVDDNKINLLVASTLLRNFGLEVTICQSGIEAINHVKSSKVFDLILMDIRMPEMDGLTATRKIRELNKEIPIIALSANAFEGDIKKSMAAGMNHHISKPIDKNDLFFIIYEFLHDKN